MRNDSLVTRLGVMLGAAILVLGFAPSVASAKPAEVVKPTTTVTQLGGIGTDGASWNVVCDGVGCTNFFTLTAPTNRGQFFVFCNGWGWVAAPPAFGPGSFVSTVNCGSFTPPLTWQFNWWVA